MTLCSFSQQRPVCLTEYWKPSQEESWQKKKKKSVAVQQPEGPMRLPARLLPIKEGWCMLGWQMIPCFFLSLKISHTHSVFVFICWCTTCAQNTRIKYVFSQLDIYKNLNKAQLKDAVFCEGLLWLYQEMAISRREQNQARKSQVTLGSSCAVKDKRSALSLPWFPLDFLWNLQCVISARLAMQLYC